MTCLKVSIITPTYNHEKYISECMNSVLSQSYFNWEQIIVDDGSTDQTADIVKAYANHDARIRYLYQRNHGIWKLSYTYNRALEAATGDVIAILEGDDFWPTHTLELLIHHMEKLSLQHAVVYGKAITVGTKSGNIIGANTLPNDYELPCEFSHQIYTPIARIPPQAVLIRKSALKSIGGFVQPPYLPLVDRPTFLELSKRYKFYHVDDILACWRQHGNNVTSQLSLHIAAGAIPWVSAFFESLDAEQVANLKINLNDALRCHRDYLFWMALSYLKDIENVKPTVQRIEDVSTIILPKLTGWQQLVLRVEMQYLKRGMSLSAVYRHLKKII